MLKQEVVIKAPEIRGAILELAKCHNAEVCIDGPAGTGKTFGILYYIHLLLLKYPGAKALIARKYAIDLAASVLATYQEQILDPREGIHYFGGSRAKPACFEYPNGSMIILAGLDRPARVRSLECDLVYINEATECTIDDIEFCRMRLRKGVIPWQQVIMDTNPDAPTHHLNQRMNSGTTIRILSRHEDNPRYYDAQAQDWTEEGRNYIFGILEGLTGVRYARYRLGLWSAAEGTVYEDAYDRARNVIKPFEIPLEWPRYLSIDFGYTNPFVCKWYAKDNDGRLYVYREIYKTKTLVEDHALLIKKLSRWGEARGEPYPREVVADHDAEGRGTFERHTGLYTRAARKSVSDGIQAVATRLRPAGDGKPRLLYFENCLVERDTELAKLKRPTCSIEEFDTYIWDPSAKKGEQPKKQDDHGMDADRYMIAYFDLGVNEVTYYPSIWR